MPYMGPLMGKAFNQINAAQANALATGQQLTADESAALLSSSKWTDIPEFRESLHLS